MATPTYFEKVQKTNGKPSYLFVKRLNPKSGIYPLFTARFKRKMKATSDAEAVREAKEIVAQIELLQEVARKDGKHVISIKDKNKAADIWVSLIADIELAILRSLKGRHTREAEEANEQLTFLIEEVVGFYETRHIGHEGEIKSWLTDFGDHLLKFLKDGQGVGSITEGIEIYLKQTQRDHLSIKETSVRAAYRVVSNFVEIIGDKQLDQISRKDVEKYISTRLETVKSTSVQREMRTLSALWNKCAQSLDLQKLNPFANQPIRGLGSDAVSRHTPTLLETQTLLVALEEKSNAAPESYVWPMIAISALTGLRLSESWGLLSNDWNKDDDTLWVQPNVKRKQLKTTNSVRPIPVLAPLAKWLDRYFFCVAKYGGAKTPNSASASCVKALKHIGFHFGNHSLRHGFKQRLIEIDAPMNTIEELMGWSSQSMARNYGRNLATTTKRNLISAVYQSLDLDQSDDSLNLSNTNVMPLKEKKIG